MRRPEIPGLTVLYEVVEIKEAKLPTSELNPVIGLGLEPHGGL